MVNAIQFDIWHRRLGHMSQNKMKLVSRNVVFPDYIKHFMREICPKAKQHRLPFPKSHISSVHAFELIHIILGDPTTLRHTWGTDIS